MSDTRTAGDLDLAALGATARGLPVPRAADDDRTTPVSR